MGYVLRAVIADHVVLRDATRDRPSAALAPLAQGLALLAITDALFDNVPDGPRSDQLGFWRLPGGFERVLAEWSRTGSVAYVEAEYFGGAGWQRAAVWSHGALAFGPSRTDEGEMFPPEGSPISQALRRLGVVTQGGADEFASAGLGRHRDTDDWIEIEAE